MEVISTDLRRTSRNSTAALPRVLPLLLVAVLGAPLALGASIAISVVVAASEPVSFTVPLPAQFARATWSEEVETFSERLQDGFDLADEQADVFSAWILEASVRQQLPPELVASLIYTESTFRMRVRSWAGAVGPAQVKPRFWKGFCGDVDLFDPEQNVYCGAQIVAHYAERCGDFDCAFRIYNVGARNLRDPYYRERSHHYLAKIEDGRNRMVSAPVEEAPTAAAL